MTLPQLPTDNLYKFLFLAGIFMIGASSLLYVQKYGEINAKLDDIKIDMLASELQFYRDTMNMSFEMKLTDELQVKDSIAIATIENLLKTKQDISNADIIAVKNHISKTDSNLMANRRSLLDRQMSSHIKDINIEYKFKKLKEDRTFLLVISIFCGISFIVGCALTNYGYKMWKVKVQEPTDQKLLLELQRIKSEAI